MTKQIQIEETPLNIPTMYILDELEKSFPTINIKKIMLGHISNKIESLGSISLLKKFYYETISQKNDINTLSLVLTFEDNKLYEMFKNYFQFEISDSILLKNMKYAIMSSEINENKNIGILIYMTENNEIDLRIKQLMKVIEKNFTDENIYEITKNWCD